MNDISEIKALLKSCSTLSLSGLELRDYQISSAWKSVQANSLVVLPTGLGKTIVALIHVALILNKHESNKKPAIVIMIAPTRALIIQHVETFRSWLKLEPGDLMVIDGSKSPKKREQIYNNLPGKPIVFFMTPQTLSNDLLKNRFPRKVIIDLIFDEAHHARDNHPYALIYRDLKEHGVSPRVLALTASPGNDKDSILELCSLLDIEKSNMIFKSRKDQDVKEYIQPINVKRVAVVLPKLHAHVIASLKSLLFELLTWLLMAGVKEADVLTRDNKWKKSIPKMFFLNLLEKYMKESSSSGSLGRNIVSKLASCVKIHHMVDLIETQGLESFMEYHEKLMVDFKKKPSKATGYILANNQYNEVIKNASAILKSSRKDKKIHPKLVVLKNIVKEFLESNPGSKILVFAKYRTSVKMIMNFLGELDGIKVHRFVGQASRSKKDQGMKRANQEKTLKDFKEGNLDVLVATSVAEEGLDIAECNLVIFYETVASPIKFIQRMGRTGRKQAGNVVILYTSGTMDQFRMKALDSKMVKLKNVYYQVKNYSVNDDASKIFLGQQVLSRKAKYDSFFKISRGKGECANSSRDSVNDGFSNKKKNSRLNISELKQWQDGDPIMISGKCLLINDITRCLEDLGISHVIVEHSDADLIFNRNVAIKILKLGDACDYCLNGTIFKTLEQLNKNHENNLVIVWSGNVDLNRMQASKKVVIEWIKRFSKAYNVKLIECSSLLTLKRVLMDIHGNSSLMYNSQVHLVN
ncbi:MAG: helicase-related protein [Promethearchaeota archaeon]